jgi:hypothetical protein
MIILTDFEKGLLLRLRSFERQAERSQITEEQRTKWLYWSDILADELGHRSDFLKCVVDRYIDRVRNHKRAVLSFHSPTQLAEYRRGLPAPGEKAAENGGSKR